MSVVCIVCEKTFTATKNLYRHVRNVHKTDPNIPGKLLCPSCEESFLNYNNLREHLHAIHNVIQECITLQFPNKTGFYVVIFKNAL